MIESHRLTTKQEVDDFVEELKRNFKSGQKIENLRVNEKDLASEGSIRDYFVARRKEVLGF